MKLDRLDIASWLFHPQRHPIPISAAHNPPQSHQFSIHRFPTTRTAPHNVTNKGITQQVRTLNPLSPVSHRRWSSLDKRNDYWQAKLIKIHFNLQGIFRSRHLSQTRWELILRRRGRIATSQGCERWESLIKTLFAVAFWCYQSSKSINNDQTRYTKNNFSQNIFFSESQHFFSREFKTFSIPNPANNLLSRFSHRVALDV